jgi:hypothetical protein
MSQRDNRRFFSGIDCIDLTLIPQTLIYQPVKVKSGKSTESSLNGGRCGGGETGWGSVAMTHPSFEPDRSPAGPVPQVNSLLQPSPIQPWVDRQ